MGIVNEKKQTQRITNNNGEKNWLRLRRTKVYWFNRALSPHNPPLVVELLQGVRPLSYPASPHHRP